MTDPTPTGAAAAEREELAAVIRVAMQLCDAAEDGYYYDTNQIADACIRAGFRRVPATGAAPEPDMLLAAARVAVDALRMCGRFMTGMEGPPRHRDFDTLNGAIDGLAAALAAKETPCK